MVVSFTCNVSKKYPSSTICLLMKHLQLHLRVLCLFVFRKRKLESVYVSPLTCEMSYDIYCGALSQLRRIGRPKPQGSQVISNCLHKVSLCQISCADCGEACIHKHLDVMACTMGPWSNSYLDRSCVWYSTNIEYPLGHGTLHHLICVF